MVDFEKKVKWTKIGMWLNVILAILNMPYAYMFIIGQSATGTINQ